MSHSIFRHANSFLLWLESLLTATPAANRLRASPQHGGFEFVTMVGSNFLLQLTLNSRDSREEGFFLELASTSD